MTRRLVATAVLALLFTSAAAADHGAVSRKQALDEKIQRLRGQIAETDRREGVLTGEISAVSARIRGLEQEVAGATARLGRLEAQLAATERRLERLTELHRLQTARLLLLRRQQAVAERRLSERLVAIYQADDPSTVEVLLSASSLTELIDALDYVNQLGRQDRGIVQGVTSARQDTARARARTARTRAAVRRTREALSARVAERRAERDRLLASQQALVGARGEKTRTLSALRHGEQESREELESLERASAELAAAIRAAQQRAASQTVTSSSAGGAAVSSVAVSSSGFIWPVSGPVTSGFGPRWGRMHSGIDISAPTGTPIRAAAAGTVIVAGWMGGYGNLVVIDHGGGLATAYAHQSSIGAGVGQSVSQGQVIGYVGSTGNSTGPHLHFEVRVNGSAVDPLGYL